MELKQELIIVLDFGGQYNQLVARRVRENNVYCEIYSYKTPLEEIKKKNPKGIILTGGPDSCYLPDSATYSKELFELGVPVLGLCYGAQLMQHLLGGKVERANVREYGKIKLTVDKTDSALFENVPKESIVWMSHTDYISKLGEGFEITSHSDDCPVASYENTAKNLYGIQFHPEVLHSEYGHVMLGNFIKNVCKCECNWKMDAFVENSIKAIREKVGNGKVLCVLSGGVDSSVAAVMLNKAVGENLTCVFVDHGLLRKNEGDEVEAVFGPNGNYKLNFIRVNAAERFYSKLAGVSEPEKKRKIIGEEFIRVFERLNTDGESDFILSRIALLGSVSHKDISTFIESSGMVVLVTRLGLRIKKSLTIQSIETIISTVATIFSLSQETLAMISSSLKAKNNAKEPVHKIAIR